MVICLQYFAVFWIFSSRIPCCLCCDVFFKFIMEQFPITPIIFEVIELLEWIKHQKCFFAYISHLPTMCWRGLVHFRSSSCRGHSFPFCNTILGIDGNFLYQMTEFVSRMSFLESILLCAALYVTICSFVINMNFLEGIEFFLVLSRHVVETHLVQFIVYWSMYVCACCKTSGYGECPVRHVIPIASIPPNDIPSIP